MSNAVDRKTQKAIHRLVQQAVDDNLLPHISEIKCHDCGEHAVHYHHDDYVKPLAVIPLCAQCHVNRHDPREVLPDPPFKPGLVGSLAVYEAMPPDTTLLQFLVYMRGYFKSIYAMAQYMELSHGSITHVLNGQVEDSPTLRKSLRINKHPKQWRVRVRVDEALFMLFNDTCEELDLTPQDLLAKMLRDYRVRRSL